MKKTVKILLAVGFIFMAAGVCLAEEDANIRTETKEISGALVSRSPMNSPVMIGIMLFDKTGRDMNQDMFFAVDKDMKLTHKKSFGEINNGDTIGVVYEDKIQTDEEGKEKLLSRTAKTVKFLKSGKEK